MYSVYIILLKYCHAVTYSVYIILSKYFYAVTYSVYNILLKYCYAVTYSVYIILLKYYYAVKCSVYRGTQPDPACLDPPDPCGPAELVRLVPAYEAARGGQGAPGLPQQDHTRQPDQRGPQRQLLSRPPGQQQHGLHRLPGSGERALLHLRLRLCIRHVSQLGGGRLWTCHQSGGGGGRGAPPRLPELPGDQPGARAGQDPGWGALHRQALPRPRRGGVAVQRVEVCGGCHRPPLPDGLLALHRPVHHRHPHVGAQLCGGHF